MSIGGGGGVIPGIEPREPPDRSGGSGDAGAVGVNINPAVVISVDLLRPMFEPEEPSQPIPAQLALSQERRRRGFTEPQRTKKPVTSGLKL